MARTIDRPVIEITPEMVKAGVAALFFEYDGSFDPAESNPEVFVTQIFLAMSQARYQCAHQVLAANGLRFSPPLGFLRTKD